MGNGEGRLDDGAFVVDGRNVGEDEGFGVVVVGAAVLEGAGLGDIETAIEGIILGKGDGKGVGE